MASSLANQIAVFLLLNSPSILTSLTGNEGLFYLLYIFYTHIRTYILYVCTCVYYSSSTWCFTLPVAVGDPRASHTSNSSNSWKGRCHMLRHGHHVTRTRWSGWGSCRASLVRMWQEALSTHVHCNIDASSCSCQWFLHLLGMHLMALTLCDPDTKAGKCVY